MGRFLYFLVMLLLARTAVRYAVAWIQAGQRRHRVGGDPPPATPPAPIHKGAMVRDPICGVHVPESRALAETRSGERFYFCSEECRRSFLEAST